MDRFQLFPDAASTAAGKADALYVFLWVVSAFFTLLIFLLVMFFALKYRRRSSVPPPYVHTNYRLELLWTIIPFIIVMIIFFWGVRVYFYMHRPPPDTLNIQVIGRQWMWKVQHPNGRREINELHVPRGQAIELTLASQDVIHSFFIPAFRVKQDAVPGRYTRLWFRPTRTGVYHLFCAEYCGTEHAKMIGRVVVLEPEDYQAWLSGVPVAETPVEAGARLFVSLGCVTCHGVSAPTLAGLFGSRVQLADGRSVTADEQYIRRSILDSTADIVAGYEPIMPSYRGQLSEEQLMHLLMYIRSLRGARQQPEAP